MAYLYVQRQIDRVVKVPKWAEGKIVVGELVLRVTDDMICTSKGYLKLGKSYTKFFGTALKPHASDSLDAWRLFLANRERVIAEMNPNPPSTG